MPAHIVFKWIHVVFANLKRLALGTFHGFREKHFDAYLGEFAFRWNWRRHFHSAMDTMLGIGQRIAPVTHRGIVGDMTQWKKEHIGEILKMCHPNKRQIVEDLASYYPVHRVKVLEELVWWVDRLKEDDSGAYGDFQLDFAGVREFGDPRGGRARNAGQADAIRIRTPPLPRFSRARLQTGSRPRRRFCAVQTG